jgi:hypothetical protein
MPRLSVNIFALRNRNKSDAGNKKKVKPIIIFTLKKWGGFLYLQLLRHQLQNPKEFGKV